MKKRLSVTEYATLHNCSRQNVLKFLADNRPLSGVTKSELIGKTWVLTVDKSYYDNLSIQASKGFGASKKK